jgi:hypothetical protein
MFVNAEESEQHVTVTVHGKLPDPVLYDPFTQKILPATFEQIDEQRYKVSFTIAPLQTLIVTGKANIQ